MREVNKKTIPRQQWRTFFDQMSSHLKGKAADITLLTFDGAQHQSRLWQLHGVTYDPHDDALIVSCRQQEHVIDSPESVTIEGVGGEVAALEVVKRAGGIENVRFMAPLLISAP
jgi:hypothetical protein